MSSRVFTNCDIVISEKIFVHFENKFHQEGIFLIQDIFFCLNILSYDTAADAIDEFLQLSEDPSLTSLKSSFRIVVKGLRKNVFQYSPKKV